MEAQDKFVPRLPSRKTLCTFALHVVLSTYLFVV